MNEKFNENAIVEKFTNILGIAVRLIIIDPMLSLSIWCSINMIISQIRQVQKSLRIHT